MDLHNDLPVRFAVIDSAGEDLLVPKFNGCFCPPLPQKNKWLAGQRLGYAIISAYLHHALKKEMLMSNRFVIHWSPFESLDQNSSHNMLHLCSGTSKWRCSHIGHRTNVYMGKDLSVHVFTSILMKSDFVRNTCCLSRHKNKRLNHIPLNHQ